MASNAAARQYGSKSKRERKNSIPPCLRSSRRVLGIETCHAKIIQITSQQPQLEPYLAEHVAIYFRISRANCFSGWSAKMIRCICGIMPEERSITVCFGKGNTLVLHQTVMKHSINSTLVLHQIVIKTQ